MTIAASTNIMEMDIVILESDFSYTKEIGKLLIKWGKKDSLSFCTQTLPLV